MKLQKHLNHIAERADLFKTGDIFPTKSLRVEGTILIRRFDMSKLNGEEKITNDDGSQLKVQYYDDKIVVHEKDAGGNPTGHTTDWFDNQVHVHDEKGSRWEGAKPK
ncbi:MAG: hypothetical protein LBU91_06370 [Bacteroidales bacterium]|nr:hypothetical protein [Bacteroidales bacterium]